MDYIYDFSEEQLVEIIKNVLEDLEGYKEDVYSILPECTKYGCSELNVVKDNEYICFYHIEYKEEYICKEALNFLK